MVTGFYRNAQNRKVTLLICVNNVHFERIARSVKGVFAACMEVKLHNIPGAVSHRKTVTLVNLYLNSASVVKNDERRLGVTWQNGRYPRRRNGHIHINRRLFHTL